MHRGIHYNNTVYQVQVRESKNDEWEVIETFGTRFAAQIAVDWMTCNYRYSRIVEMED